MRHRRLTRLAAEAASAPSPMAALRAASELRRELDAFERLQVAYALGDGASFAAIARELGVSRQAVHRRFREVAAEDAPLSLGRDVFRVIGYAREEADAMGAGAVGSEHVLLGVLRAPGSPAAAVLRDAGATLTRARTQIGGAVQPAGLFAGGRDDPHALLADTARVARARHAHRIEVADLVVAALEDPEGGASRTLRALGADPGAVRAALSPRRAGHPAPTARA